MADLKPHYSVRTVQMQTLSAADQIALAAQTDVMLSMHSNGLTHALWMPAGGAVVEIFPNGHCSRDYVMIATASGQAWVGLDGDAVVPRATAPTAPTWIEALWATSRSTPRSSRWRC